MRIAVLVDQFPAVSETFILQQIVDLIDRGHEVDIYSNKIGNLSQVHSWVEKYRLLNRTFYPQMPDNRFLRVMKALGIIIANPLTNPAIWVRSIDYLKYKQQASSLKLFYGTSRFVGKKPYDIIHCQLGFLGLQGLLYRQIGVLKGKLVTSFRGNDFIVYINKFGKDYFNELWEQGDFFLPVCESMKRQMIELGCDEKKITVYRTGLDLKNFAFTQRQIRADQRVKLVTIARLAESKGIEYGIRAIEKLVKNYPHIEYLIVGDGPLMGELQQLIRELDLQNAVKLLGWKKRNEVIEILSGADILVAPSVTAKNGAQEGIPNVLKEAMAIGLPVVSTHHSGIPELIENGVSGFLVPERDADTLAEKIGYLADHPEIWLQMSRAGRACVEKSYDLNKLNDRLVEIYQNLGEA
ncbi:glycosyltransferase [Argonema antarcticum]|uniref:glycosyltransferase n=1 Tax=Argonema antarcticum TaxID=2942763 RepID=UPI002013173F|nr:glycosyltransferase [Argonema antarcticum]MCL1469348.1 glycosyltransferase [Argonema antarcticum A004/B2]